MTVEETIITNTVGLLELASQLGNISPGHGDILGYSRVSFYRFKELYDEGGEQAFQEVNHRETLP